MEIEVKDGKVTRLGLAVMCRKEGDAFVAYLPALDLSTHGETFEDAMAASKTAAKAFIEQLIQMGTLDEVMTELGWERVDPADSEFPYIPPFMSMSTETVSVRCPA